MAVKAPSPKFAWEPKNEKQALLRDAVMTKQVVFAIGAAGTGKTLVPTYTMLDLWGMGLRKGGIESIIASRPLVSVGKELGAVPGDVSDKISPFMKPVYDIIVNSDHSKTQEILDPTKGILEGVAIAYMRGSTFMNSGVIIDEAQNLARGEFEMILTRVGENSKLVITGDPSQCDLKNNGSGLLHAISLVKDMSEVAVIEFNADDVVRSDFVGKVIKAYAADREREAKALFAKERKSKNDRQVAV